MLKKGDVFVYYVKDPYNFCSCCCLDETKKHVLFLFVYPVTPITVGLTRDISLHFVLYFSFTVVKIIYFSFQNCELSLENKNRLCTQEELKLK